LPGSARKLHASAALINSPFYLSSRLMETWLLSMSTVPHQRRQAIDRLPSGHAPSCMLLLSVKLPKPSGTIPLSSRLWPVSKDSAAWCVLQHTNRCHASPNVMHPQIQCARKITTTPLLATSGISPLPSRWQVSQQVYRACHAAGMHNHALLRCVPHVHDSALCLARHVCCTHCCCLSFTVVCSAQHPLPIGTPPASTKS
jgi:hypothetical protein